VLVPSYTPRRSPSPSTPPTTCPAKQLNSTPSKRQSASALDALTRLRTPLNGSPTSIESARKFIYHQAHKAQTGPRSTPSRPDRPDRKRSGPLLTSPVTKALDPPARPRPGSSSLTVSFRGVTELLRRPSSITTSAVGHGPTTSSSRPSPTAPSDQRAPGLVPGPHRGPMTRSSRPVARSSSAVDTRVHLLLPC